MKHTYYRFIIILSAAFCLAACRHTPQFEIAGNISNAEGETLYLEQTSLKELHILDSVRLTAVGTFRFTADAPAFPELYRLRIGKRNLVFAVDSTEHIAVQTTLDSMAYTRNISGSESTLAIADLRRSLISQPTAGHKQYARQVILTNPRSIVAYYALFQLKDGGLVFDPYLTDDRVCYSAVATAFSAFMPDYERSKALYNLVSDIISTERKQERQAAMREVIEQAENTFLDIALPDEQGVERRLSDYKGQVILLDFSAAEMEQSNAYIFELRELYNRYHTQGLEIYQVSADYNRLLWEESVAELPWTTVRSEQGANAPCFRHYNVSTLPTLFLFNRQGEVIQRFNSFEHLPAAIQQCLR